MPKKKGSPATSLLPFVEPITEASQDEESGRHSEYQPLPSVWEGTDAELLERMLDFYPKLRLHCQDPQGADQGPTLEESSPCATTSLLLDRVSQIPEV